MTAGAAVAAGVRRATPADNAALIALAAACPMEGDVGLCVDRAPDFFQLNRLEGERWRVGVAEGAEGVVGCVAVAERSAYLHGRPTRTLYVSDLKVHPAHRGGGAADALTRFAVEACREVGGEEAPVLLTILAGNRSMERRARGPRGLPHLSRFATIRSHSVPLLWRRRPPTDPALRVAPARAEDLDEMADLWRRIAPIRQFAPAYDAGGLARWIAAAPALDPAGYWLARRRDGRLTGFLALWDQASFKQLRVTGYSPRLRAARAVYNGLAPLLGASALPPAGGTLRCLTAVHVCVPADEPAVLRSLVLHACDAVRGRGYAFANVGLDVRDPLSGALRGLLAQPTDVHAYVTTPAGRYRGPPLGDRPLHYETALV